MANAGTATADVERHLVSRRGAGTGRPRGADFLTHEKFRIVEWIHSTIDPIPVTLRSRRHQKYNIILRLIPKLVRNLRRTVRRLQRLSWMPGPASPTDMTRLPPPY